MLIIPVIDILDGRAVRAIGGDRSRYSPLASVFCDDNSPVRVADQCCKQLCVNDLYVADLDAITKGKPNWCCLDGFQTLGLSICLDAGVRTLEDALRLSDKCSKIILGSETLASSRELDSIISRIGPGRLMFSLDLRGGIPVGPVLASDAINAGIRELLILDLSRIGRGQGPGTEQLFQDISAKYPYVSVFLGGGIRTADDLHQLSRLGLAGVLVGQALHSGSLTRHALTGEWISSGQATQIH